MAGGLRERSVAIRRYGITYRGGIYLKKNKTMIVVFLTPAVLLFLGIFLYPIIRTVIMSFFKIDGVTDSMDLWKFVGFGNYTKLMSTSLFKTSFFNLFRIWLIGGLVVMSLSLLFAVILTSGIRGKKFFRAIIYMPNIVSAVALATMWLQYVYSPRYGLLKDLFTALHLDNLAKIQFLDNDHKFWALLFAYCFGMVGYHMLIWLSGIERISPEYYEAATIDGATKPAQFRYMTLPLLKGVFKTNITMWSVSSVGFFVWSQLFSTVTADTQTITPYVYMYMQIFGGGNTVTERNAGLGAAIGNDIFCFCFRFYCKTVPLHVIVSISLCYIINYYHPKICLTHSLLLCSYSHNAASHHIQSILIYPPTACFTYFFKKMSEYLVAVSFAVKSPRQFYQCNSGNGIHQIMLFKHLGRNNDQYCKSQ